MKITLTTDDGEVLNIWSVGYKPEFDIEDLDAVPEHDFYLEDNYSGHEHIGETIWNEMINFKVNNKGEQK